MMEPIQIFPGATLIGSIVADSGRLRKDDLSELTLALQPLVEQQMIRGLVVDVGSEPLRIRNLGYPDGADAILVGLPDRSASSVVSEALRRFEGRRFSIQSEIRRLHLAHSIATQFVFKGRQRGHASNYAGIVLRLDPRTEDGITVTFDEISQTVADFRKGIEEGLAYGCARGLVVGSVLSSASAHIVRLEANEVESSISAFRAATASAVFDCLIRREA